MAPLIVASIDTNASTAALSSRGDVACNAEVVRTQVFMVDAGNVKAFVDATDKPKRKMRVVLNSISQYWVVGWKQKLSRVYRGGANDSPVTFARLTALCLTVTILFDFIAVAAMPVM